MTPSLSAGQVGVRFDDVTRQAFGRVPAEKSFGAGAWGDYDGDGDPDLFLGNHAEFPSLWRNNGDGTFTDVAATMFSVYQRADSHGAAWGDYDGDGDLDLIECVGAKLGTGQGPNRLWRNDYPSPFVDVAAAAGVDDPFARSRSPLWFDWNDDGRLDLMVTAFPGPGSVDRLFTQQSNGLFIENGAAVGFFGSGGNSRSVQLGDFDSDGALELILQANQFPTRFYEFDARGFTSDQQLGGIKPISHGADFLAEDLDGDLSFDFYVSRYAYWSKSEVAIGPDGAFRASSEVDRGTYAFSFKSAGDVTVDFGGEVKPGSVFLGKDRVLATSLTVKASDPRAVGIPPSGPVSKPELYVCRESDSDQWLVILRTPVSMSFGMELRTTTDFREAWSSLPKRQDSPDGLLVSSASAKYRYPDLNTSSRSVVGGDFDNDGDIHLYVVRSGPVLNLPNRLLENREGSQLIHIAEAAGAEGSPYGVGDSVSIVDFDQDGFLDLLLTNGDGLPPFNDDGRMTLLRNRGNGNRWLEVDLRGNQSNATGVGARVYVTTSEGMQLRCQAGGIHRSTQNHERLHFGLGGASRVSEVRVIWPGTDQETVLRDLAVNQVITISE
ncbi:MAG: CRTAC1 family protein [Planctomycetes bacterium]|nr:CRTAC1 family protein [Planctomycetota bacterium]